MTMDQAKALKEELIAAGIAATIRGKDCTLCLTDTAKFGMGGFTGSVQEAVALVAASKQNLAKCAAFNAAQPKIYDLCVQVNDTDAPPPGTVRHLVPGDEVKWAEYGNGGSREFVSGTIRKAGVIARARFGRTTSGKPRTRWLLSIPHGVIRDFV